MDNYRRHPQEGIIPCRRARFTIRRRRLRPGLCLLETLRDDRCLYRRLLRVGIRMQGMHLITISWSRGIGGMRRTIRQWQIRWGRGIRVRTKFKVMDISRAGLVTPMLKLRCHHLYRHPRYLLRARMDTIIKWVRININGIRDKDSIKDIRLTLLPLHRAHTRPRTH